MSRPQKIIPPIKGEFQGIINAVSDGKGMPPKPKAKFEFDIGDGVQLLSGSPHMTVIGIGKEKIECCWFDKDGKEHRSKFPKGSLVPEKIKDLSDEDLERRIKKEIISGD